MISCITSAGIGNPGGLESFVMLAARHGIGGVDTSGVALEGMVSERGADGARQFLADAGVRIGSIGLAVEWRKDEERFLQDLTNLAASARAAAALGCKSCCTYALPSVEDDSVRFAARSARRLRSCARILGDYGIRMGLEFVGPHHLRTQWRNIFIYDMAGMLEFIDCIGEPNVGLLLDSYHWYTTGGDKDELRQLDVNRIVHVHINDAKPVPVEEALDNDRLFPGEGVIDLTAFIGILRENGYDGFISLEVLAKHKQTLVPDAQAAKAAASFRRFLSPV